MGGFRLSKNFHTSDASSDNIMISEIQNMFMKQSAHDIILFVIGVLSYEKQKLFCYKFKRDVLPANVSYDWECSS